MLPGACCCFSVLCVLAASACMLPVLSKPPPIDLFSDQQALVWHRPGGDRRVRAGLCRPIL